jgi:NitT/TauT family transport system permease protein
MQRATEQALPAAGMDGAEPRLPRALRAGGLLGFYLALLVAWEVLFPLLRVPAYIVPVPSMVVKSLYHGLFVGHYLQDLGVTLVEMLSGFAIAVALGIVIGALIVEFRFVEKVVYPLIVALQSLPKIALAPLILIWVGFGIESKITMAALVAFFPMLVNTISGLRAYDRDMNELFRSLSATRLQRLWRLKVPAALPFIIAGLDVSFIFALLGAIVGEFVGASSGLGYAIVQLQYQFDTAGVFAILVLLALIGVTGHTLISLLGRRAAFWQASNSSGAH